MVQYWQIALLSTTSAATTILDSYCLNLIRKDKRVQRPSTLAVRSLLFCHLLQGTIVVPSYILKKLELNEKLVLSFVCDAFRFSYLVTNYASCLSLLIITLDRMFAIKKPLLYRSFMTNRKMACAFIACWTYVVTLCSVPFIPSPDLKSKCAYNPQRAWTLAMLTCHTMLPFLVIIYCYFVIFKSARKARIFRTSVCIKRGQAVANQRKRDSEVRIAKISSVVAFTYLICWGPSLVYYFFAAACPGCLSPAYLNSTAEPVVTFVMKYLTFLNGIVAPIVYGYRLHRFTYILPFTRRDQFGPG